jgi:nucleoside-diphosphate-sugar epimerase
MFEQTRAIITGGSSGLGKLLAERLLAAGAEVVLVARDAARLEATRAALLATQPGSAARVHVRSCDVSQFDDSPMVEALNRVRTPENRAITLTIPPMRVHDVANAILRGIRRLGERAAAALPNRPTHARLHAQPALLAHGRALEAHRRADGRGGHVRYRAFRHLLRPDAR